MKYMIYLLVNLKRHITKSIMTNPKLKLLPIKPSITSSLKYLLINLGLLRSCGLRRDYSAKIVCVCTCCGVLATQLQIISQDSLSDNGDIALASIEIRGERVTIEAAAPNSNAVAPATSGVNFQLTLQRGHNRLHGPFIESVEHGYSVLVQVRP